MAITKGKKTRRKTVQRGIRKSRSSVTKLRNERAAKGKEHRLKLRPTSNSRSVQISEARPGAERRGKRSSGSWDTQKWLIGKKLAHVVKEKLIADFRKGDPRVSEPKVRKQRARR